MAGNPDNIKAQDEALLASLGYKQELKRVFTPLEVHRQFPPFQNLLKLIPMTGFWRHFLYHWPSSIDSLCATFCYTQWWRPIHGLGSKLTEMSPFFLKIHQVRKSG
jgi:hypothetical protein